METVCQLKYGSEKGTKPYTYTAGTDMYFKGTNMYHKFQKVFFFSPQNTTLVTDLYFLRLQC